ncbi:hypothetical protein PINS_up022638 [Pythium insidiosum]|nr:hypothetical protein PINS_up022638 [Pythium insidiosum]
MRLGDAVLRPRDLASYEETPLYFAWRRLYAAGNATLSTDWLDETEWEMLERQRARVPPRRGLPPGTTSTATQRESARASAFLRRAPEVDPYTRGSARMRTVRASMQALKERKLRSKREANAMKSRRHTAILKQIERELLNLQPPPKTSRKPITKSPGALSNQDDDAGASPTDTKSKSTYHNCFHSSIHKTSDRN